MSNKKTLEADKMANSGQVFTLAGRILTSLSPLDIDSRTAQFWIDNPRALNARIPQITKLPTIVQVFGFRLGPSRGLATLINCWFGGEDFPRKKELNTQNNLDVFALDIMFESGCRMSLSLTEKDIHPFVDIVVVDTPELYTNIKDVLEKDGRNFRTTIFFVNSNTELIPVVTSNTYVFKDNSDVLKWIGEYQIKKIMKGQQDRLDDFLDYHKGLGKEK